MELVAAIAADAAAAAQALAEALDRCAGGSSCLNLETAQTGAVHDEVSWFNERHDKTPGRTGARRGAGFGSPVAGAAAIRQRATSDSIFPAAAHSEPVTGRVFVIVTRTDPPEPRLQVGDWEILRPLFGTDVSGLGAGTPAIISATTLGFPVASLRDIPAGDYYVQGLLNVYTQFHRSDGHVVWAHMDQWEGQRFNRSPGNLVSEVQRVHLDPHRAIR